MSFSLKYLFALVALAAIFTAALIYPTSSWALIAVNLTVVVLAAATLGVWFQKLHRTFWLSFCFVGWLYLGIAFTPTNLARLPSYLPSKQISFLVKEAELEPLFANVKDAQNIADMRAVFDDASFINPFATDHPSNRLILRFRRLGDIMDALFALLAGTLAGVISVLLIRPKREP